MLMAVMSLPLSAFAWTSEEGRSCTSSFGDYYVGLDGEYYRSQATMHTLVYNDDGSTYVKSYSSGNAKRKHLITDNSGTHQVYCVESGIDFNTGNTYTSKSGQNSSYFKNLPTDAQFGVMMALMYGWHEGKSFSRSRNKRRRLRLCNAVDYLGISAAAPYKSCRPA